jgi:glycopeptide antibiotics resistance protein
VLLVTAIAAWPLGRLIANRFGRSRAAAVLFIAAVGVVMALTLTPNYPTPGQLTDMPPHFLQYLGNPHMVWAALTSPPADSEQIANIALYVPVGLFGRFVWRSAIGAAAFGIALTIVIETCQYGIPGRDGSLTDIRNNAVGAILGALLGAVAARVAERRSTRQSADNSEPIR